MSDRMIPKPKPGGLDADAIVDAFAHRMMYSVARDQFNATEENAYQALAYAVRDRLMDRWFKTQDRFYRHMCHRVHRRAIHDSADFHGHCTQRRGMVSPLPCLQCCAN